METCVKVCARVPSVKDIFHLRTYSVNVGESFHLLTFLSMPSHPPLCGRYYKALAALLHCPTKLLPPPSLPRPFAGSFHDSSMWPSQSYPPHVHSNWEAAGSRGLND
jgi:hypothetical protein